MRKFPTGIHAGTHRPAKRFGWVDIRADSTRVDAVARVQSLLPRIPGSGHVFASTARLRLGSCVSSAYGNGPETMPLRETARKAMS